MNDAPARHWRRVPGHGPRPPVSDTGDSSRRQWRQATAICADCPVRRPCLLWALGLEQGVPERGRAGMFGGLTPRERARIRSERDLP